MSDQINIDNDNSTAATSDKDIDLEIRYRPKGIADSFARIIGRSLRGVADLFFQKRYSHRALVLETIAAVPGMIAAMLTHFRCLRNLSKDDGWIKVLLDEAENERMHLMTFIEIAKPNLIERIIIITAQIVFSLFFLIIYIFSSKTAHRLVGYLEEEAIVSYNSYLNEIDNGNTPNVPAPEVAIKYWNLKADARLRDVVLEIQKDEAHHRDVNHQLADKL